MPYNTLRPAALVFLWGIAAGLSPKYATAQPVVQPVVQTDSLMAMPVQTGINTEALLLYQGLTCNTNKHDIAKFQQYALCTVAEGKFALKKTAINFYTRNTAAQYTGLRCTDSDSTLFMLCANKSLPEGIIYGKHFDWTTGAIDYSKLDIPDTNIALVVDTDVPDQPDYWAEAALVLVDKKTRQQQVLCQVARSTNPTPDMIFTPPYTLHWYGDLDGDGKPDYIISGESGQAAEERLYLSSYAYRTELVREVARWNYCLSND